MKVWWGLVSLFLVSTSFHSVHSQTNPPLPAAQAAYRRGYQWLQQAERGGTPQDRRTHLAAAQRELTEALTFDPEHYRARGLLAQTLFGLARETPDTPAAGALAQEANHHFRIAAAHPSANWRILNSWGRFLTYCAQRFATAPAERCAQLAEARQLFDRAQPLAKTLMDKTTVAVTRGECLWEISQCADTPEDRRAALSASLNDFAAAYQAQPAFVTGPQLLTWGRALLASARTNTNRTTLAAAVVRLEESLSFPDDSAAAHYELARAHGLLGQSTNSLTHLRLALQSPSGATLRERARTEPDLANLITQPEFVALLQAQPSGALVTRFNAAEHELTLADQASTPADALQHRQRALKILAQTVTEFPGAYRPQLLHLQTLAVLARTAPTRTERYRLWQTAIAHCQPLTQLPDHDAELYQTWGALWLQGATDFGMEPAQQVAAYHQAIEKFHLGLKRVTFTGEKFRLERELARALTGYGVRATGAADQTAALQQADRLLGELTRAPAGQRDGPLYRVWGETLTGLGRLGADRLLYRQAIEKFLTALEIDGDDELSRYHMAVAYALAGQPQQALRHLQTCLAHDPADQYRRRAATDPDLHLLRRYPEFMRMIGESAP